MRDVATRGARILGTDHDPAMLRFARELVASDRGAALVAADAAHLPFRDASLDGVAAVSLLGCVGDPAVVLREVARVLRSGGTFVVTITNRSSILRRLELVASRLIRRPRRAAPSFHAYAVDETVHLLRSVGFVVELAYGYGLHFEMRAHTLPGETLSGVLERALPHRLGVRVARNVIFVARRDGKKENDHESA